jgi:hypothetical protein
MICSFYLGVTQLKPHEELAILTKFLPFFLFLTYAGKYVNPFNPKLVCIIFNNSVCTAKKTQHLKTLTKIIWLNIRHEFLLQWTRAESKLFKFTLIP